MQRIDAGFPNSVNKGYWQRSRNHLGGAHRDHHRMSSWSKAIWKNLAVRLEQNSYWNSATTDSENSENSLKKPKSKKSKPPNEKSKNENATTSQQKNQPQQFKLRLLQESKKVIRQTNDLPRLNNPIQDPENIASIQVIHWHWFVPEKSIIAAIWLASNSARIGVKDICLDAIESKWPYVSGWPQTESELQGRPLISTNPQRPIMFLMFG